MEITDRQIAEITDKQIAVVGYCNCQSCQEARGYSARAELKAAALLRRFLTSKQLKNYVRHGQFEVTSEGGRKYMLGASNVRALDGPLEGASLCITLYDFPRPDLVLARKLLLETDERRFLETARGDNANSWARQDIYRDLERQRAAR